MKMNSKNLYKLRKHKFTDSGVCNQGFLDRNPDLVAVLLHDVMYANGYVPVLGSERVEFEQLDDDKVGFDVSILGAHVGDGVNKIDYFTVEGVTVWSTASSK